MSAPTRPATRRASTRTVVVVGLAVSLLLAAVVSFYASGHPDGLEFVSRTLGFGDAARSSATAGSPLAGYTVRGVSDARVSGGLAGVVGVLATGLVMAALVVLLRRLARRRRD